MQRHDTYEAAEEEILSILMMAPQYVNKETHESLGMGFCLTRPNNNKNAHSDYQYAEEFFRWMISGKKELSEQLKLLRPSAEKFLDSQGLPEGFSASYGWKIQEQLTHVKKELIAGDSRRAYINILCPADAAVLAVPYSTHEYPCTIGMSLQLRNKQLHAFVQMRSNNCFAVMPYDVYNFTSLQASIARSLGVALGTYTHYIVSAHIYKRDFRSLPYGLAKF